MTPHWLTIEKLVVELGDVCASEYELRRGAQAEAVSDQDAEDAKEAVKRATDAVGAVLSDLPQDPEEVVLTAWRAIAQAHDAIDGLRRTVQHARALREEARRLQDQALRLRGHREPTDGSPPARHATDRG